MRVYKYVCDGCKKALSDPSENIAISHIVLDLKEWGWVDPKESNKWKFRSKLAPTVLHFCNQDCIKKFFMKKKFEEFIK